jgi:sulfite reductase alpha subunit-like flavoprotein
MIGPGTGIAPFMGFLQRRVADQKKCGDILFTGFRHRASEYLYGEQLEQWAKDGFVELHVAFSRDGVCPVYCAVLYVLCSV